MTPSFFKVKGKTRLKESKLRGGDGGVVPPPTQRKERKPSLKKIKKILFT